MYLYFSVKSNGLSFSGVSEIQITRVIIMENNNEIE